MTRIALVFASAVAALLLSSLVLFASPALARPPKATTKVKRNKGWRRRAQDWQEAKESTTTIVTNPSTLGKGKGKGKEVVYTAEDEDGRTTFVIDCTERTFRKAGDKEKMGVLKGGVGGKGKGKASASTVSGATEAEEDTKTIPTNICDDVDLDGSSGAGAGSGAGVNGGNVDFDGNYPPLDVGQLVEQAQGGLYACARIAAQNAPTTDESENVVVTLDVIHEVEPNVADGGSETILKLMRADLQDEVAPVIADCISGNGGIKPSGSSINNLSGGGTGSMYGNDTLVTNVEFDDLSGSTAGCSEGYQNESSTYGGICMLTTIPVTLYYEGNDTSDFQDRVQTAIDGHRWDVPGLIMTSTVHRGSDNSFTAVEGQEAQEDDTIGPAGYLTIAAAALVLLLAAMMLVRRKRRDELVKHVSLEDDDETYLRDLEGSDGDASDRLANVVGEDNDSVGTGWTGASHFRNGNAMDAYFSNTEDRPSHQDVHVCSSATCEVCERNRQAGVQFIPSGNNLSHAPLPPDAPRQYSANDTVSL